MGVSESVQAALDWAVAVDADEAKAVVEHLRKSYPREGPEELAERVCSSGQWKSMAGGLATGLVSNPLIAAGAAILDAAVHLRVQVEMAARVALCHDANHFQGENAREELLVPILGATAANEFLKQTGAVGAAGVTRQLIRKSLTGRGGGLLQGVLIRAMLRTLPARGFLAKSVPILGGIVSGWWNWQDSGRSGERVRAYFAGRPLPAEPE